MIIDTRKILVVHYTKNTDTGLIYSGIVTVYDNTIISIVNVINKELNSYQFLKSGWAIGDLFDINSFVSDNVTVNKVFDGNGTDVLYKFNLTINGV